jgi:hypothetical protein
MVLGGGEREVVNRARSKDRSIVGAAMMPTTWPAGAGAERNLLIGRARPAVAPTPRKATSHPHAPAFPRKKAFSDPRPSPPFVLFTASCVGLLLLRLHDSTGYD